MEATSNWQSESEALLQDILQERDKLPTGELVDILDEDKCISLTRPEAEKEGDEGCVIRLLSSTFNSGVFSIPNTVRLTGFTILSEARVLEVCTGRHDEYLKTVHGTLMGDFGDSKIFKSEVQFERLQESVKIELKATCHEDSVWIYGFFITTGLDPESASIRSRSRFGSENLSSVLRDKDVQMSKEAMKFRQMLESYNSTKENSDVSGTNPMSMMSMMFGSMLPTGRPEVSHGPPRDTNIKKKKVKDEDEIESVMNKVELETKRVKGTLEGNQDNICKVENALKHLALLPENRTKDSISCVARNSENGSGPPLPMNKLLEKLQNYMEDSSAGPKSMMELTNILQKSVGVDPVLSGVNQMEKSSAGSKFWNSNMQDARTILKEELTSSYAKPVQPDFRGANLCTTQQCDHTKDADFDDRIVQRIEKIFDDKIAAMEERLMKKFEEKLHAKTSRESSRLDRIESLLEKISEKV